jgi:myo-inositol-1-phosphate synthase
VAIAGVGNCASSLLQGIVFYADAAAGVSVPGLMHAELGGYRVGDIRVVAAFDVDRGKVGRDLAEAILAPPNNTFVFAKVPDAGVSVQRGPTMDGLGKYLREMIEESDAPPVDVAAALRAAKADVLVSYLPVGSELATRFYAKQALAAGCGFVNCIPVFIASDPAWRARFEAAGLPLVGDDIKSQLGATILHRSIVNLFRERGVRVDRTYQLNFGGNSDFANMLERDRLLSKKISKTRAVTSQLGTVLPEGDVHVGPSDHVPWLTDRKWAHIRVEGTTFGNVPLSCEVKLEVWDSPNSAGVVIDAVRCAKLAKDRGVGGALGGPSSYFMKSPPEQFTDQVARERTEAFISGTV